MGKGQATALMQESSKYYVPVCLYPHTRYRTRAGLNDLFEKYSLSENPCLIVVADRLLALDRLVTGRYWQPANIVNTARRDAEQVFRLIRRTAASHGAGESCRICYWDDVADDPDYIDFSRRLQAAICANPGMSEQIDRFVGNRIDRFGDKANPERAAEAEREYLLSEVTMSVFGTERLGYAVEIWERPPAPDIPDPLKILYGQHLSLVADAIEGPPKRKLDFLYEGPGPKQ